MNKILLCFPLFLLFTIATAQEQPSSQKKENKHDTIIYIAAGQFSMGDRAGESDEKPVHTVYLDAYWIGKYEVTNGEYKKFIKEMKAHKPLLWNDTSINPTDNHPVIGVSWKDAIYFTQWKKKETGLPYRLPTEAEWEKAARGSDKRKYPWGNNNPKKNLANFVIDEDGFTFAAPVGSFLQGASPYGVLDMAGNVWEWCMDWYSRDYYKKSPKKNPQGAKKGVFHVTKGGSWVDHPHYIRISMRNSSLSSSYRNGLIGFRLAMEEKHSP